ncbi:uncharacterized protein LOC115225458 [Octopus sinensis]|uniref:Uncharacterized protein LOC115225458 n=1 Tax=Octopus sinensis TaxID=2607531 RepID=A0A7E6FRI5_9MOLL|nr:uncharacterized protein LOC115225458 [Octopus sinensis]
MDILKFFCCLSALFYLTSAKNYRITQSGPAVLHRNVTLSIRIPNMKRPAVWKCHNYKYECDRTCADGPDYKVTQKEDTSTLWIRNITEKCSTWKFEDDNLNGGRIHLEIKNGAQGTSSLRTKSILVIGMIIAVII